MNQVSIGTGALAGKGVYAARDFAAGDVVVSYQLQRLTEAEYMALAAGEDLFVHSFGGERYLYPEPARFVNHSDDPSCVQDFGRGCNVARRPIAAGEPITINANDETSHELDTFLQAYERALFEESESTLSRLIDESVTTWRSGRAAHGRTEAARALLGGVHQLTNVEWLVGTGRWEALCSATLPATNGSLHLTMLLKVVRGNWQMVYHHVG